MTRLLFIDTETNHKNPNVARLAEVAVHLVDWQPWGSDSIYPFTLTHLRDYSRLIRPDGWRMTDEASAINGITQEMLEQDGRPLAEVLADLVELVDEAQGGRMIAHNLTYDSTVLTTEYIRAGIDAQPATALFPFCTMRAMTARCKLPGRFGKPKWPRLGEAYEHCFGHPPDPAEFGDAHRAMADVLVCKAIYLHGLGQRWWEHA